MKCLAMLLATVIGAVATIAASQEASPTPPPAPTPREIPRSVTTSGEIVRYDAGKTIVIRQSDDRVVTYELAPAVPVSPEIHVGRRVAITVGPAADGVVRVTRMTPIGPDPVPAVAAPPTAPFTRETEKTAQTPSVTVTGDVVRYDAGRTIVVRTPDSREVTYSIAPGASAPAEVPPGGRVSIVTESSATGTVLVTRITAEPLIPESGVPPATQTKTQTTTAYGTITAYEPGQSISILQPNGKTVTYAIDGDSALPSGIATGKTVVVRTITRPGATRPLVRKVTYSTGTTTTKKKG
jgi:endonuclease YncB( thermonuclease family)